MRRHADELEGLELLGEPALGSAAGSAGAHLVERGAEGVDERQDPHLDEEAPGRDDHRRLRAR